MAFVASKAAYKMRLRGRRRGLQARLRAWRAWEVSFLYVSYDSCWPRSMAEESAWRRERRSLEVTDLESGKGGRWPSQEREGCHWGSSLIVGRGLRRGRIPKWWRVRSMSEGSVGGARSRAQYENPHLRRRPYEPSQRWERKMSASADAWRA